MNYKKEYERAKTKLEVLEAIGLVMFYVGMIIFGIMRWKKC